MDQYAVRLSNGRTLEVLEAGDSRGFPVFVLHGTPGSRLLYPGHVADAEQQGIRLIGYSRPGYGGSTRFPRRRIMDAAGDVAGIADSLGLERFAVWGHSGGGDPALACAALLPERVVAAACLAGLAPYPAEGIDWFSGMGEFNVSDYKLMLDNQAEWEEKQRTDAGMMIRATRAELTQNLASLLSEVDKNALSDELYGFLHDQMKEGLGSGVDGMIEDGLAQSMPWGFDPASIRVPVQIWHGRHDHFVPFAHGKWLATRIPSAEAHLEESEGHVSLIARRISDVHRWLVSKF